MTITNETFSVNHAEWKSAELLAELGFTSKRYDSDMDYKEAVDEWVVDEEVQEPTFNAAHQETGEWAVRLIKSAYKLGMLSLQGKRYGYDDQFRQAVNEVLNWSMPKWQAVNTQAA